ncbi:hypothetical protein DSCW_65590 [Desulfosarcina widdelii]|uniref:Uncharacterized protein n=1 Tax=Desulfosarcina widdelii TaxID=947919 RepID=A0A5K7ZAR6_9BACT|nr:hypothetical protein [Desulfosarcina widdelii]BBO79142.1 hypothetical protein DSCW_65590 [Desulfosarcina widdelii]
MALFFLVLTFVLHLLFMNAMLGSAIMAFICELRGKKAGPSKDISTKLPYTIAFTVNLGVAPLLFLQVLYGQFIYVSSVLMAGFWLAVIGLIIMLYYSAYIYDFRFEKMPGARTFFIGLTAILGLIVAFLFTNNMTLMLRPETWQEYFGNRSGTLLNLNDPTLWPRYLHFIVASIAVGGLFQAVLAKMRKTLPDRQYKIDHGMRWFTIATVVQILVGFWFLISLPREVMLSFMGGDAPNTVIFILGLAVAAVSLIFGITRRVLPATAATIATVLFMAIVRDLVRTEFLKPVFHPSDLKVAAQYSPMIVFLIVLVLGLGIMAYMLHLAADSGKEAK